MKNYPNETMRLLNERASCRNFQDRVIEPEILEQILNAGLKAATGGNLQPYSIIKIESDDGKRKLVEDCHMQGFVGKAPTNLLFCIDWRRTERWSEALDAPYTAIKSNKHFWIALQDTIIAAQNICTAADAMGLGSVYIGTVESCFLELKELFNIPKGVFPVVLLTLGYPVTYPKPAPKLGIETIVHDEEYRELPLDHLLTAYKRKYPKTIEISDERLEAIFEVVKDVDGEKRAFEVIESIKKAGHINMAQRYFGLHYSANWSCSENSIFIKALKEYGFDWIDGVDFP